MSNSKRSLLDLLPPPTQRDTKRVAKKAKKKADDDSANDVDCEKKRDSLSEQCADNEQYRVWCQSTLSACQTIDATPMAEAAASDTPRQDKNAAEELIIQAIEEDKLRAMEGSKKSTTEIEFKEISQDTLKSGVSCVQREVDAIGLALKTDEGEEDKVVLPAYTLSKEAKRKHQITTLYQTMKQNETKLLSKEAQSAKTQRETASKYGWR